MARKKCRLEQALEMLQSAIKNPSSINKRVMVLAVVRHVIAWLAGSKTIKLPSGFAEVDEDNLSFCDKCFRKIRDKRDLCYTCSPPMAPPEHEQRNTREEELAAKYAPELEAMRKKGVLKEYAGGKGTHRTDGTAIGQAAKPRFTGRKRKRQGGH